MRTGGEQVTSDLQRGDRLLPRHRRKVIQLALFANGAKRASDLSCVRIVR